LALVAAQFGALVLLVRAYELEGRTLFRLLVMMAVAWPVYAVLPRRWRLPFFAMLSVAGLFLALEPDRAIVVIGAGVGLIGLVHLPIGWSQRIGLLLAAGMALSLARADLLPTPVPQTLWATFGSLFLFRLAVYVQALRHGQGPTGFWAAVSYFFMLPNPAFPLFPVVDYKTFAKSRRRRRTKRTGGRESRWSPFRST
jgi:hypothetical protein